MEFFGGNGTDIADLVNEETETDDTDREGPDTDSRQPSSLGRIQVKFSCPNRDQEHPPDKSEGCRDQGHKTAPEQNLVISVVHLALR